jgi:hypothetical protein
LNFTEEWYDEKYVYGCYCSCDPATMAQMSDRVRGIRGKKLFFHTRECAHGNAYNFCTLDSIKTALESKVTIFKTLKDELDLKDVDWKVVPSWIKTLFHYLKLEAQLSQCYYSILFYKYLHLLGYKIAGKNDANVYEGLSKSLQKGILKYDSIQDIAEWNQEQINELEGRIKGLTASTQDKQVYQKILFHKYIQRGDLYKE